MTPRFDPTNPGAPVFRRPASLVPSLDLTPLVDVVFQLLIFFMLSSSFLLPSLPLQLPQAGGNPAPPSQEPVVVTLASDGIIFLNRDPVELEDLADRVEVVFAERPASERTVRFRGDDEADYGRFVDIVDTLRRRGIGGLQLEHRPATP